jgi:chloramphenicol 3-O phosphotransferase
MNLGVDVFSRRITPPRYRPGMGLRPGGERPEIEALIPALYAAFYDSVAAHSRHGLNVVADVGHHDAHSVPMGLLPDAARRLSGLPALLVGIRCPLPVIMARRDAGQPGREGRYLTSGPGGEVPRPVLRWQEHVHQPGLYDLEIDTSAMTPAAAAAMIRSRLDGPAPSAFRRLAAEGQPARRPRLPQARTDLMGDAPLRRRARFGQERTHRGPSSAHIGWSSDSGRRSQADLLHQGLAAMQLG